MEELIMPKSQESDTGGGPPKGYERYVIPGELKPEDEIKLYREFLQRVVNKEMELEKKVDAYKDKVDEYKKELEKQSFRNIEIIGIFSAILALLIIDVSIVKSVESFLSAILLIIGLTCSVAIFAVLMHLFFIPADKIKFGRSFWIPIVILIILVIVGVITHLMGINLY